MKTAMGFANLYINREVYLPIRYNISELINLYNYYKDYPNKKERQEHYKIQVKEALLKLKHNKLTSLSKLKLNTVLENSIYISLYELTQAILFSTKKPSLISVNRKIIHRRKKTIKSFKTALEYPFLTNSVRKAIDGELERLKQFDKNSGTYHAIKEVDYHKEKEQPTILTGLLGGNISYEVHLKKIEEFLSTPLRVKEGRRPKFFFKVLLIVIFKLLHEEANISIEKAKNLTAKIINEYCKKQKISEIPTLTSKDIDNALHSSA